MSMTSENEERISKNWSDSPLFDEINSRGNEEGYGQLKKGPWTVAEDEILIEYVTKHGEGNWNSVKKYSGLMRCGKSCRLRWSNHLRPDLKKGAFTPEEECQIIKLHAEMGNKWARMAAELPGRTDNEIKNYWNTRIKRKQRAGLPLYPPDVCLQPSNQSQQTDEMNTFSTGNVHINPDFMPVIPSFNSNIFELNQPLYPRILLDNHANISRSNLSSQSIHSSYPMTVHPSKRPRGPDSMFPSFPTGSQYQVDDGQQFILSSAYDASFSNVLMGSHAVLNGNPSSTSEPAWAMKMELPSLQTQMGGSSSSSWSSPSSPLPSLESFDILKHAPPTEHREPCNLSPRNSGLLEEVLCEAKSIHDPKWEAYSETRSPLVQSSSAVFTEGNPYLDEPGFEVQETTNLISEIPKNTIFPRPDFLHSSNGFGVKESNKDHLLLHDPIGSLFDEHGL